MRKNYGYTGQNLICQSRSLFSSGSIHWFSGGKVISGPQNPCLCQGWIAVWNCRSSVADFPQRHADLFRCKMVCMPHLRIANMPHGRGLTVSFFSQRCCWGGRLWRKAESTAAVASSSPLLNARLIFRTLLLFWLMAAFYCSCPKRIEVLEVLHIISGIFSMHSSTASIFKVK